MNQLMITLNKSYLLQSIIAGVFMILELQLLVNLVNLFVILLIVAHLLVFPMLKPLETVKRNFLEKMEIFSLIHLCRSSLSKKLLQLLVTLSWISVSHMFL